MHTVFIIVQYTDAVARRGITDVHDCTYCVHLVGLMEQMKLDQNARNERF
jgi:hypothetical protein